MPTRAKGPSGFRAWASCPSTPTAELHWGCLYQKKSQKPKSILLLLLFLIVSRGTECKDKNMSRTAKRCWQLAWDEIMWKFVKPPSEMWWENSGKFWQKNILSERVCLLEQWVTDCQGELDGWVTDPAKGKFHGIRLHMTNVGMGMEFSQEEQCKTSRKLWKTAMAHTCSSCRLRKTPTNNLLVVYLEDEAK